VAHCQGSLVETIIGTLPVKDAHLQQVEEDIVGHLVPVHHQEVSVCSDHVHPEYIIMVKVKEVVLLPPFLDEKLLLLFFSWEMNAVGTPVEDL